MSSKPLSALLALAVAVGTAGCRDSTAPDDPLVIELALAAQPTPTFHETEEGPRIHCNVSLTARARGTGTATWQDARFDWFYGFDRTTALETTSQPAFHVQDAWGAATIAGGETRQSSWFFNSSAPFEVAIGLRYSISPDGPVHVATTRVTCGSLPQAGAAPPVITVTTLPASGELEVGDAFNVTYSASGEAGLWTTVLQVSGAFELQQRFTERLATSVQRTVQIVVPAGSRPGAGITVTARTSDAAFRAATHAPAASLTFVDRTPPGIISASMVDRQDRPFGKGLAGQYAPGDAMSVRVSAYDNNSLGYVVYELGAPASFRDSIALPLRAGPGNLELTIPVRSEWVGSPLMSVYVRDAAGHPSPTLQGDPDSLRIYPVVQRPTTVLSLGSGAEIDDIAYDPRRDLVYLASPKENRVLVLSPSTMTLHPPIELGARPSGIDLTPSGDSLLVAIPSSRSVTVVDLTRQPPVHSAITIPLLDTAGSANPAVTPGPDGIRVAANGKAIVMLSYPTRAGDAIVEVDLRSGAQRLRRDALGTWYFALWWSQVIGRTNDHSHIYLLTYCPRRYDSASDTFTPCGAEVRGNSSGMTFDATGSLLTRGQHLLDRETRVLWTAEPVAGNLPTAAVSPEGDIVYLGTMQGALTKARISDRLMLERTVLPIGAERIFVAPSGAWALVLQNMGGARVARVDLR